MSGLLIVLLVAVIGTYLLTNSHAATPYASITAASGTPANGAAKQTSCSGSTDGSCVAFNGTTTSGGGSNMMVGMNAGGWNTGNPGDDDVASAVKYVRIDQSNCPDPVAIAYPVSGTEYTDCPAGGDIVQLAHDGAKVILDFSGPYETSGGYDNTGGVSALDTGTDSNSWAANALAWYKEYCGTSSAECPAIEVLNEPPGSWFWGANAGAQQNATAYASLVKSTYTLFHNAYGSNSPKILASVGGGTPSNGADVGWGDEWWSSSMSQYVDGVIVHPYGGTDMDTASCGTIAACFAQSAAGQRYLVTDAHSLTGEPVYITEVGWPTDDAGPTATTLNDDGDSLQWPEADSAANAYPGLDQCDNVYNFVSWARSTGYVNAVMIYGYISGTSNNAQYGLEFYNDSTGATRHKDGWFALEAAGAQQANPCPSAANGYAQPG